MVMTRDEALWGEEGATVRAVLDSQFGHHPERSESERENAAYQAVLAVRRSDVKRRQEGRKPLAERLNDRRIYRYLVAPSGAFVPGAQIDSLIKMPSDDRLVDGPYEEGDFFPVAPWKDFGVGHGGPKADEDCLVIAIRAEDGMASVRKHLDTIIKNDGRGFQPKFDLAYFSRESATEKKFGVLRRCRIVSFKCPHNILVLQVRPEELSVKA